MSKDILDIRDIAQQWSDEIDEGEVTIDYTALCEELGIDATPDALEYYGEREEAEMIREDYFTEYAQQLAEDTFPYPVGSEAREVLEMWPYRYIDWERAARELKYDYTSVTFDGADYLIRSV